MADVTVPTGADGFAAELTRCIALGEVPSRPLVAAFWAFVYDEVAERYDGYEPLVARHLVELVGPAPGDRVLDVGTGSGGAARHAAARATATGEVLAVDVSPAMLDRARRHPPEPGAAPIRYVQADACDLADVPDGGFDVVLASLSLVYCGDVRRALAEVVRVTRPGGRVGIATMTGTIPEAGLADQLLDLLPERSIDGMRLLDDGWARRALADAGLDGVVGHEHELEVPDGIAMPPSLLQFLAGLGLGDPAAPRPAWAPRQPVRFYVATPGAGS